MSTEIAGRELHEKLHRELLGELREELHEELCGELQGELREKLHEKLCGELQGELQRIAQGIAWRIA